MKNVVLTQRFQYYSISPFKDYSLIVDEKKKKAELETYKNGFSSPTDMEVDVFFATSERVLVSTNQYELRIVDKKNTKKRTKYYYGDESMGRVFLRPYSEKKATFYTTKESHLLRHYGRPFSSVTANIIERTISIEGDCISVRYYTYRKSRGVNCIYFRKRTTAMGFKINFKTGNIISYEQEVKSTRIRQNSFKSLEHVINRFFQGYAEPVQYLSRGENKNHPVNIECREIFDNQHFFEVLKHTFLHMLPHNKEIISSDKLALQEKLMDMCLASFVAVNEIKVPNDYQHLIYDWYPTKKFLKKNENKLIASVLDRVGLKTKGMVKLLHKHPTADLKKILLLGSYFGYDQIHKYLPNIDVRFILSKPSKMDDNVFGSNLYLIKNRTEYKIKDTEKTCLLKLINEFMNEVDSESNDFLSVNRGQISQFNDHLEMLIKIRKHLPDTEMRASTLKEFHNEHIEFSKIQRVLKKGYSIQYIFEDDLIKHIEEPIVEYDLDDNHVQTYYPVLLKIDGEYTEEGSHMHHCVATYADRENSIIVSLREGSAIGSERVTSEYEARSKSCVQSKYFCNAKPPERFLTPLDILKTRIANYKGSIKSISKEKIPLVINGVQILNEEPENTSTIDYLFGF